MEEKKNEIIKVSLWTDGSCNNNSKHHSFGVGGWAFSVLSKDGETIFEDVGFENKTSSSRMEQTALLEGLKWLKKEYSDKYIHIEIYSDSAYVVNCFNQRWFDRWFEIEFLGIKNSDLWLEILSFRGDRKFKMNFNHVKGHSGIENNERVDFLAGEARKYYLELLQS